MKSGIEVKTITPVTPEVPVTPVVPEAPITPVNSEEIDNLQASAGAETPSDTQNGLTDTSETSENASETEASGTTKHIVTYVGGGNWIDADGKVWARESVRGTDIKNIREYNNDEFQLREDLQFMIGYGSMTITTVSL